MALALLSAMAPAAGSASPGPKPQPRAEFAPGEVLVRFDPGTGTQARDRIRDVADVRLEERLPLPRAELLHTRPGQSVQEAISELESSPDVAYAEPNYIHHIQPTTPNDPLYSNLWGLNNTGQTVNGSAGTADADIDASEAWDTVKGSTSVIVAVLDTGLALDRADIAPHVWVNPGETANGADDGDPLSFIDDVNGWDFAYDDKDPRDGNNHGTHVAGTVGADGDNGVGVVGVNWNVTIMPVQVCTHVGSCPVSDQIAGIDYARDMGADVINMSIGGAGFSQAQENAINNAPGVLFAVAAGNDGTNNDTTPSYPCSHDSPVNMICVAASTQSDGLASFSNFGATSVDLAAPGTNVLSTVPTYSQVLFDNFEGANNWDWDGAPAASRWELTTEAPSEPSATQSVTDSEGAPYGNNADATMTLAATSPINLTGRVGCTLQYRLRLRTADSGDLLTVYASTNQAGPYTTVIDQQTGDLGTTSFIFADGDLEAFENDPSMFLQFRFTSNGSGTDEGAHVDNVEVRCATVPDTGTLYGFLNGTSMATPHVAGAVALLLSADPGATVAELRSAILNGVETKPAFAGVTVTGGRLNVNQALAVLTDTQDPDPFTLVAPADGATVTTRTPQFEWNAATDDMGISEYELYVNNVLVRDNIHPGATSAPPATPLSEGTFPWFVKARDLAGNDTDSDIRNVTVDVDETPPSFPTSISPANGASVNTQTPTFTWTPATDSESGVSKHQLVIDGLVSRDGLAAAATSATPGAPLAEGAHNWLIRAFDGAGNSADSVTRTFTVDLAGAHARNIALTLKRHLKAKGKVTVPDGFAACAQSVDVDIERKTKNGWRNVDSGATGSGGTFSVTLPDREGKYRALAPKATVGADTCEAATSPGQRHRHSG